MDAFLDIFHFRMLHVEREAGEPAVFVEAHAETAGFQCMADCAAIEEAIRVTEVGGKALAITAPTRF